MEDFPVSVRLRYFCASSGNKYRGLIYFMTKTFARQGCQTGFAIQEPPGCKVEIYKPKATWGEQDYNHWVSAKSSSSDIDYYGFSEFFRRAYAGPEYSTPDWSDPLMQKRIISKDFNHDSNCTPRDRLVFISVDNIDQIDHPIIRNFWQIPFTNRNEKYLFLTPLSYNPGSVRGSMDIEQKLFDLIDEEGYNISEWPIDMMRRHLMIRE